MQSKKFPYPPNGRSEIPTGRGVLKVKMFEANYEANLQFRRGSGASVGGVWIFSGTLHCLDEYSPQ